MPTEQAAEFAQTMQRVISELGSLNRYSELELDAQQFQTWASLLLQGGGKVLEGTGIKIAEPERVIGPAVDIDSTGLLTVEIPGGRARIAMIKAGPIKGKAKINLPVGSANLGSFQLDKLDITIGDDRQGHLVGKDLTATPEVLEFAGKLFQIKGELMKTYGGPNLHKELTKQLGRQLAANGVKLGSVYAEITTAGTVKIKLAA